MARPYRSFLNGWDLSMANCERHNQMVHSFFGTQEVDAMSYSRLPAMSFLDDPVFNGLFFRAKFQGISPKISMAKKMVRKHVPPKIWILEISHWCVVWYDSEVVADRVRVLDHFMDLYLQQKLARLQDDAWHYWRGLWLVWREQKFRPLFYMWMF